MLIIGLGNEFCHDDAVGLIAARRLRECGVSAEEYEGDMTNLMERWQAADAVIVIDAVCSGAPPGTVHRLDASTSPLQRELFKNSTHALGLVDAVELARAIGMLPAKVYVFGMEVRDLSAGVGLSPEIERALPALIEEVLTCAKRNPACN
jgi:hydrogenase maturation protease